MQMHRRTAQPSGAATPEEADTRRRACIHFLRLFFRWQFRWQHKTTLWPGGGKRPVSPYEPLCAIFLRKASVYPLSPAKSERGPTSRRANTSTAAALSTSTRRSRSGWSGRFSCCSGTRSAGETSSNVSFYFKTGKNQKRTRSFLALS